MKIYTLAFFFLVSLSSCQSFPPEERLYKYFETASKNLDLKADIATARWVANGYLSGAIHTDAENGLRYFSTVPVDKRKAAEIFAVLYENGDAISQVILGILHRKGEGVSKDLVKSAGLLEPLKHRYVDASGEYGLVLHEMLRKQMVIKKDESGLIATMLLQLNSAADQNYIAAINALRQIYTEGQFVGKDLALAGEYDEKSSTLIKAKLKLAANITDAKQKIAVYSSLASSAEKEFERYTFLLGLGMLGTISAGSQTCHTGCNPASLNDLRNWGVL